MDPSTCRSCKSQCDASWFAGGRRSGVGIVARDASGHFVAARVASFENKTTLQITTALLNHSTDMSFIGLAIEDGKAFMSRITGAASAHVRRQAN
ncbi:hypothetical protein ACFX10_038407 [Malus domestica]